MHKSLPTPNRCRRRPLGLGLIEQLSSALPWAIPYSRRLAVRAYDVELPNTSSIRLWADSLICVEVGGAVRRSLDHWERREWDLAVVHACNALDGTAKKRYPHEGVASRFKRTLRDSLDIFATMAAPTVDFEQTRFPIAVKSDLSDSRPDIADVLYGIHRWNHGHDNELPKGFELTPHGPRPLGIHIWSAGKIQLPAAVVIGVLAVAVFSPENKDQTIPDGYQLSWYQHVFNICLWWGWQDHFREIIGNSQIPCAALDFGESWNEWAKV